MLDHILGVRAPARACALLVLATLPLGAARADDAYVCDNGRLVYANAETLEKLKQTDPCIAGYYAHNPLRTERAQLAPALSVPAPSAPLASIVPPSQPAPTPPAAPVKAKPPGIFRDARLKGTTTATSTARLSKAPARLAAPPQAAAGTDFRNVRVINAPAGSPAVYHHER
jgi:hypothetical protein